MVVFFLSLVYVAAADLIRAEGGCGGGGRRTQPSYSVVFAIIMHQWHPPSAVQALDCHHLRALPVGFLVFYCCSASSAFLEDQHVQLVGPKRWRKRRE